MDGLNNNNENSNSYETNFDSFSIAFDDVRNHNESRTTARITPLTYQNNRNPLPSFSHQEHGRSNVDRMKDRQIAILIQKNNLLETELLAMRQKYPVLHEYSMMSQCGSSNKQLHLQTKLLTTALSEKFEELRQVREELRQTKKEYELVMQERTVVHRELQEQTTEIDMLKSQNKMLQEQLNFRSSNRVVEMADSQNGLCRLMLNEAPGETEALKSEIVGLQTTVKELTIRNDRSCMQLNSVLDKYYKLKMILANGINSNREFKSLSGSRINEEVVRGTMKMIDLKMILLKIPYEKTCIVDSMIRENGGHKSSTSSSSTEGAAVTPCSTIFNLGDNDQILDIEGTCVADWSDNQILDYLTRFEANSFLRVIASRKAQIFGKFLSWKIKTDSSMVKALRLSPLWMVTRPISNGQDTPMFKLGDILQLNHDFSANSNSGIVSVNITRLSPFPLETNGSEANEYDGRGFSRNGSTTRNSKAMSVRSSYPLSGYLNASQSFFPVLPAKQKLSLFNETYSKSSHHPISDYNLSQHSNISVSSAPPVPPRSSTSLQYSFMENLDLQNMSNTDMEGGENREFTKEDVFVLSDNDKLNLSVQSAIQFNFHDTMNTVSREVMSASFNCTSEFSTNKIPKLGKCRKITLTVPSKIFCLRDLGLHLLHGKTEDTLVSKSDVDVSVINQIFIRNVDLNSIAQRAGLVEGDEIITINNHAVSKMTAEEAENVFLTNPLKPDKVKYSLLIKAQFNPLKMHELFKEKNLLIWNPNLQSICFTRSMYDESNSSRNIHDSSLSHRLNVVRSSSNLNITRKEESENSKLKHGLVYHLQTHSRTIRINPYTVLKLIKIMGGSNIGIFITNVIYKDSHSEIKEKESLGNKLAVGDRILEVNGECFDRMIGDVAVESLNKLSHQSTIKVIYDPPGLLAINSDPFCQEKFYMEATFSFSELHNPLTTFSGKRDKSASVCSRLDHLVVNIPFIRNYHLRFEKHDILLVDATILPTSMTKTCQDDKNNPSDWHAWVVDKQNRKIRQGMIPSAFWIEKMLSLYSKSFQLPITDRSLKSSMRSTPSSPISETNEFLSSPSTSFQNDTSKLFQTQNSSFGQKIFSRISFKKHSHSKTVSNDDTNKGISFQKFRPIKRLPRVTDYKRPVIILGAHSDTISMVLASSRPQEYIMAQSQSPPSDHSTYKSLHVILPVTSKDAITQLHRENVFPIVLLLNYKSPKQIRQLRICKTSQIKVSKSDCNKLFSRLKEFETHWSQLINECVFPSHLTDTCEAIVGKVDKIQTEDIWLPIGRYEYSD